MLLYESVGQVHDKGSNFMFKCASSAFFSCSSSWNLCFYHFHFSFFWESVKNLQQSINQSETEIGGNKLPVELFISFKTNLWISGAWLILKCRQSSWPPVQHWFFISSWVINFIKNEIHHQHSPQDFQDLYLSYWISRSSTG